MNKQKIDSIQFLSMVFFIIDAPLTGMNLINLFRLSGHDSYISIVLASLFSIFLLVIFKLIYNFKPELSLGEKVIYLFGKKIGFIINISMILLIRVFAGIMYYILIDFIISLYFTDTSAKIIGLIFTIPIIYTTTKGIEVISRMSLLLLSFTLLFFVITIIGIFPGIEINNFKPFLEFGFSKPFISSLNLILINYIPLFSLLCIPKKQIIDNNNSFNKKMIMIYVITNIIMLFTVIGIIGNMGDLSMIYNYPEYIVLRKVNFLNFLDRIENILSLQRIVKMYIFICILTYFISNTLKINFNKKWITIGIVISIFISSQIFRTNTHFNNFMSAFLPVFRMIFASIVLIITIKVLFKKKKTILKK